MKLKYILNFVNNFFFLRIWVCTILGGLILKKTGALTAKPTAFKYWSWELDTTYIVSTLDGLFETIRLDLKGLEIIRILPWLENENSENWLSDKTRFSYDGYIYNWISKFFVKKKFLFLPTIFILIFYIYDEFIWYELKKSQFFYHLKKLKELKRGRSWILYYYSFQLNFISFYLDWIFNLSKNKDSYFNLKKKSFSKKYSFLLDLFKFKFNQNYSKLFSFPSTLRKLMIKRFSFLVNYYFSKRLLKKNFIKINLLMKYKSYFSLKITDFYQLSFLNLLDNSLFEKVFFFNSQTTDLIFNKTLKKFLVSSNSKKLINWLNIITPNLFSNLRKTDNFFLNLKDVSFVEKTKNIYIFGLNVRLAAPKLHLKFRKKFLNFNTKYFILGNFNSLAFKAIYLGSLLKTLKKFFFYKNWINIFLFKSGTSQFFFGDQFIENSIFVNYFFDCLFFYKKITLVKPKFLNKNSLQLFYLSEIGNKYNENIFFDKKTNLFLNNFHWNLFKNKFKNSLFIFFDAFNNVSNFFFEKKNLQKKLENSSINFFVGSFMPQSRLFYFWDYIIPSTNELENFNLFHDYRGFTVKSLFVKLGPWLAWNSFYFIILLNFFFNFPTFILSNFFNFKNLLLIIISSFWLEGFTKNNFLDKNLNFSFLESKNEKFRFLSKKLFLLLKKNLRINNRLSFSQTNLWFSWNPLLDNSKYSNLAYNLFSKKKQTFFYVY